MAVVDESFNFTGLPTELQLMILCRLPVGTLGSCAQSSSQMSALCADEEIWTSRARRDFGVRLPATSEAFSPRTFYRDVLHRYRHLLGLWARRNLKHYGSLLRVSARGAALVFEEMMPPLRSFYDPLRPVPFLTVTKGRTDTALKVQSHMSLYTCETVKIVMRGANKEHEEDEEEEEQVLNLILTDLVDHTVQPVEWQAMLLEFLSLLAGEAEVHDDLLLRFVTCYHSRSLLSYTRLQVKEPDTGDSTKLPIRPGIFKGSYGPHGIELIHLVIPSSSSSTSSMIGAAGVKITGDPNVPCGEKSFIVNSSRCLDISLETQSSLEAIEAFMENPAFHNFEEGRLEDFQLPADCFERERIDFEKCKGRWSCECQIAENMHLNPRTIPGHFILFTEDIFAVLFIELRSVSLFHRAQMPVSSD